MNVWQPMESMVNNAKITNSPIHDQEPFIRYLLKRLHLIMYMIAIDKPMAARLRVNAHI